MIKCNNSESFFKKVNKELNKDKDNITLNIDDLVNHYSNIFNRPLNVSDEINDFVNSEIQDVNIDNYIPIEISKFELKSAIKQTKSSNVCGNDGISSKMIKACDNSFVDKYIFFFFRYIFSYCVIPDELNITHIVPIKKDKKRTINDINNLRPISISNSLAQIFERLLLTKMSFISKKHDNQCYIFKLKI